MTIDVLAYERHFVDHLAPVWQGLPPTARGRFIVDPDLAKHAAALGITAYGIPEPRRTPAYPAPRFDGPLALVASYGDLKKARRMGYGPFAFLEHGIGQSYAGDRTAKSHASYSGGDDRDDVELFLVPGAHPAGRWRERYPDADVAVVGCPKLDSLPSRRDGDDGPVVAVSFHFACSVTPETRPTIGHFAPAFPALRERFHLIGHGHPRLFSAERDYRRAHIEYVPEFADVCRRADVYVCDNSSTLYEFAATGRPVVVLNGPGYRRHVDHGLRFWDAADVGIQVDDPKDLLDAIAEALEDAPARRKAREAALRLVYAHRSGAAKRAAAALLAWAEQRAEVAA